MPKKFKSPARNELWRELAQSAVRAQSKAIGRSMIRALYFDEWRTWDGLNEAEKEYIGDVAQPNISRAIRELREAGYIEVRRCSADGRYNEYRLIRVKVSS